MKKFLKGCLIFFIFIIIMIAILAAGLVYAMKYKTTEVGSEKSPDGSYEVIFEQVGEPEFPFGATYVRFLVKSADGALISKENHTVFDDGAAFRPNNWEVHWYPVGVEIILKGSEQNDDACVVYYDKSGSFQGYTGEQAVTVMQNRYGEEVSLVGQEKGSLAVYEYGNNVQEAGGDAAEEQEEALSPEIWEHYLSIEPACSYTMKDGTEYKMIGIDRAAGSSYFILISTSKDGSEYSLVNKDPYLGSGGEAMWLTFLEDERTGFSCLSYSGGSYGSLYRTEDGGKTFAEVEYPSAQAYLPDGTLYNPFVMPEEVYEQEGKLYLVAGQGPDGDYYGEQGYCSGLYVSEDKGITWKYLGEQAVGSRE